MKSDNNVKRMLYGILVFAVYSFQLTMTLQMNDSAANGNVETHYANTFVLGVGFFLFYIGRKFINVEKPRQLLVLTVAVLYAITMTFRVNNYSNVVLILLSAACIGFLGGMVYYDLAATCSISGKTGLTLASGASIAFLLQFIFQKVLGNRIMIYSVLIVGLIVMIFIVIFPMGDFAFDDMLPYIAESEEWDRYINSRLLRHIILSLVVLGIMGTCEVTYLVNPPVGLNLYGPERLCIPLGYFIVALCYDRFDFKAIEKMIFCLSFFSLAAVAENDFLHIRLALFYILVGAALSFITVGFWHLGPKTKKPDLWAVFGRVIEMAEGIMVYGFSVAYKGSTFGFTIISVICFVVLTVMILRQEPEIDVLETESENKTDVSEEEKKEDFFKAFVEKYRLTPRETQVIRAILTSDAKLKVLAEDIGVSERMIYRYMTQLYEKLGTDTRAGIVKTYYDFEAEMRDNARRVQNTINYDTVITKL